MGLNESIGAFMRIFDPLVGTIFFSIVVTLPWIFGTVVLMLLVKFMFFANIFGKKLAVLKIKEFFQSKNEKRTFKFSL